MQELQLTNDKLKRFPPKLQELARFIEDPLNQYFI